MDVSKFIFYAGTTRGYILSTSEKPNELKAAKPQEASEVTALTYGRSDEELIIGYENGKVNTYNTVEDNYTEYISSLEGEGRIVGLNIVGKSIIVARQNGIINTWRKKKNNYFNINLDEKGTLDCMVYNDFRENIIGTGGEYNDYKLWDVETHQNIFKSKSLGHDNLNLPIPTSVRGITFFSVDPHLGACCSKEGHVLLYDERAQRRPVSKFSETKASYSSISCAHREKQCLVGTTRGYLQLLDMKMGKCVKTFTSFTGSVTSIVCDPLEPYVTTTSLDRFLRVHNLETKELLHKRYMKQNLTKILVKPIVKEEQVEETVKGDIDQEYEDIFDKMETVGDAEIKKQKRKVKLVEQKSKKKKKICKSKIDE